MDLASDKKVPLSVQYTDENGNPTSAPADALVSFTSDDPTVVTVSDFGDGTGEAIPTGTLAAAHVLVSAVADGVTLEGSLEINVVAGLAERINVVAGDPVEITPDT